jgi:hypothetical protein
MLIYLGFTKFEFWLSSWKLLNFWIAMKSTLGCCLKFMFSKKATKIDKIFTVDLTVKVHIFLEGPKIFQNLHLAFDFWLYVLYSKVRWRHCKILWPSRNMCTLLHTVKLTVKILSIFLAFSENVNFINYSQMVSKVVDHI